LSNYRRILWHTKNIGDLRSLKEKKMEQEKIYIFARPPNSPKAERGRDV